MKVLQKRPIYKITLNVLETIVDTIKGDLGIVKDLNGFIGEVNIDIVLGKLEVEVHIPIKWLDTFDKMLNGWRITKAYTYKDLEKKVYYAELRLCKPLADIVSESDFESFIMQKVQGE